MKGALGFQFGDKRLDRRAQKLVESIKEHRQSIVHQLGESWGEKDELLSVAKEYVSE
jgi:Transposase DNA-binding